MDEWLDGSESLVFNPSHLKGQQNKQTNILIKIKIGHNSQKIY